MQLNWPALLSASFIPLILGYIWYHNNVFGKAWMRAAGLTDEQMKKFNMPLVFGLTIVLGFLLAMSLNFVVIHQWHLYSILADEPGLDDPTSPAATALSAFLEAYGNNFRTFKHGAFHGVLSGVFFSLPIIAINAMFERKGWKYIAIHAGYWAVVMALMGGIISGWQ